MKGKEIMPTTQQIIMTMLSSTVLNDRFGW